MKALRTLARALGHESDLLMRTSFALGDPSNENTKCRLLGYIPMATDITVDDENQISLVQSLLNGRVQ